MKEVLMQQCKHVINFVHFQYEDGSSYTDLTPTTSNSPGTPTVPGQYANMQASPQQKKVINSTVPTLLQDNKGYL